MNHSLRTLRSIRLLRFFSGLKFVFLTGHFDNERVRIIFDQSKRNACDSGVGWCQSPIGAEAKEGWNIDLNGYREGPACNTHKQPRKFKYILSLFQ